MRSLGIEEFGIFWAVWVFATCRVYRKLSEAICWVPLVGTQQASKIPTETNNPKPKTSTVRALRVQGLGFRDAERVVAPGKPLFIAPKSRNWGDFDRETRRVSLVFCCLLLGFPRVTEFLQSFSPVPAWDFTIQSFRVQAYTTGIAGRTQIMAMRRRKWKD